MCLFEKKGAEKRIIELNGKESIFISRNIRFLKVTCWSFISILLLQNIKNVFNIPKGRTKNLRQKTE